MALLPATLLVMLLGVYVVRSERKWLMAFVIVSGFVDLYSCDYLTLWTDMLSCNGRISTQSNHHPLWEWLPSSYSWQGHDVTLRNNSFGASCSNTGLFCPLFYQLWTWAEAHHHWKERGRSRSIFFPEYRRACAFPGRAYESEAVPCIEWTGP